MAFTPKTWAEDDPITPAELNRIETGVDDAHEGDTDRPFYTGRFSAVTNSLDGDRLSGWAVSDNGTGFYTVTHGFALSPADYSVVVTPDTVNITDQAVIATIAQRQASAFLVKLYNAAGSPIDCDFYFVMRLWG